MTMSLAAPLSAALRDETATAHHDAENTDFMSALVRGELPRDGVVDLTAQYWFVYSALEEAVRRLPRDPVFAAIADRRLERVPALEADLAHLLGPEWRSAIVPTRATLAYAAQLDSFGPDDAPAIVAHHYVRYLGDIAGGQVIARMLSANYGLDAQALNFYDFSAVGKIPPFRARYREALDALELTDAERARLIGAAKEAFALNQAVFTELQGRCRNA
ncbi:heme oxygenase (biliverdin-producing) [Corynebacterium timonense]|uniref:Heme oxygenase n=1 Tax=Corynebacterium timonense TaxID=441500 RepID=A0A1H1QVF5_9CORY|nr:biliverdin-producing heme oxygenase [Corynebacterium timonense]SDS27347.1 heme oxygenase [Corynebacterium timonense]